MINWFSQQLRAMQERVESFQQAVMTGLVVEQWITEAAAHTEQTEELVRSLFYEGLGDELESLQATSAAIRKGRNP